MYRKRIQLVKVAGATLSLVVMSAPGAMATSQPVAGSQRVEAGGSETLQIAQTIISGLSEQPRLIGACRFSPEQSLDIYADAARTRRIRTLTAPTQGVFLTGIVGTGLAQIKDPVLGWIGTATIEPCTTPTPSPSPSPAPTPSPTPTPVPTPTPTPSSRACYQVRAAQLTVRTSPSGSSPALGVYGAGAVVEASSNPPREQVSPDGRIWAEVNAPNGTGWISRTGPNGAGDNAVRLADSECRTSG